MANKKRPGQLQTRYKKQHGLHHKHSDKYLKVYWPYLPVLVIVIIGVFASVKILMNKPISSVAAASISVPSLLNQTNQLRKSADISPLQVNAQLASAAQSKANDMISNNYWSPISPKGISPWYIIQSTGYKLTTAGENLAYGFSSTSQLVSAWESSASHKANMINKGFDDVGFGIAQSQNFRGQGPETIVVALYAATQKLASSAIPTQKSNEPFTSASVTQPNGQTIVRVEAITETDNHLIILISGLSVIVIISFLIIRHGLILKKWALESEEMIINHPFLDIALVIVLVGVATLGQSVGFIR